MPVQYVGRWGTVIFGIQMPPWEMQPIHCSLSQGQDRHTGGEESIRFCFQCTFQAAQGSHRGLMNIADQVCRLQLFIYFPFLLLLFSSPLSSHSFPFISVFHFIQSHWNEPVSNLLLLITISTTESPWIGSSTSVKSGLFLASGNLCFVMWFGVWSAQEGKQIQTQWMNPNTHFGTRLIFRSLFSLDLDDNTDLCIPNIH